jgi:hypothetical protein
MNRISDCKNISVAFFRLLHPLLDDTKRDREAQKIYTQFNTGYLWIFSKFNQNVMYGV